MKKFMFIIISLLTLSFMGCGESKKSTTDDVVQQQTEMIIAEANKQVGMPAIINFQEKKNLKWIYELCDQENLVCHAYLFNSFEGKIGQYLGECIGYGIPYSTQFSNPSKLEKGGNSYGNWAVTLPQPEPNGVFKPEGLSATWLIMIDPTSKEPRPIYIEPEIIVSPFKLH